MRLCGHSHCDLVEAWHLKFGARLKLLNRRKYVQQQVGILGAPTSEGRHRTFHGSLPFVFLLVESLNQASPGSDGGIYKKIAML